MVTSVFPRFENDATPAFVENLAVHLASTGLSIRVLVPHGPCAKFCETIPVDNTEATLKVIRIPYCYPFSLQQLCYEGGILVNLKTRPWTRLLLPLLILSQTFALLWLTLRWKPDLIHTHSLLPQGFTGSIVSKLTRCRHITTSHGNDVFGLRPNGLMGHLKRWVLKQADAVTVNSRATEKAVRSLGGTPDKIHRIPAMPNEYPAKLELVARIQTDIIQKRSPVLLFVGRLIQDKGVADLLKAIAAIQPQHPNLCCLIVGDGQGRARFKTLACELNIQNHLHWASWIRPQDVSSWMTAADLFILPSKKFEAQGLVVVEAMLAGVPVIASRLGGIPDMIKDSITGRLFPPGDVAALTTILDDVLNNPEPTRLLAKQASAAALKNFARPAVIRSTLAAYTQILDTPPVNKESPQHDYHS